MSTIEPFDQHVRQRGAVPPATRKTRRSAQVDNTDALSQHPAVNSPDGTIPETASAEPSSYRQPFNNGLSMSDEGGRTN
jgi:hypothetical protein